MNKGPDTEKSKEKYSGRAPLRQALAITAAQPEREDRSYSEEMSNCATKFEAISQDVVMMGAMGMICSFRDIYTRG
ncbi:hypothetical protein WN51_11870 [Melipona quadrifasciata]|uniref:Uncharacterized protein n=1 Tax=Melipona quadrifasciata TaxID=166423 RepID=A0A0N0BHY2_9HYME|nr:hypothetical protein WN51_11870 [Melipona quadrifasciata]